MNPQHLSAREPRSPSWAPQSLSGHPEPRLRAVTAPMVQAVTPHSLLLSFKKFGGSQTFCDIGSWLLPKVPPAPTREMTVPCGARDILLQGHPSSRDMPKAGGENLATAGAIAHLSAEHSASHQLPPRDLLLPFSVKPLPAWNQACGEGRAVYPLPSWLLAQQPQHSSPGMMLWPLSPLSLCSTLQVPQHPPPATIPAVP